MAPQSKIFGWLQLLTTCIICYSTRNTSLSAELEPLPSGVALKDKSDLVRFIVNESRTEDALKVWRENHQRVACRSGITEKLEL